MATTLETPPTSKRANSDSPSLKTDGISVKRKHLPRVHVVQQIYETAKNRQFVVIGSPAATGKTSLLQLLAKALKEQKNANVLHINVSDVGVNEMLCRLKEKGIVDDIDKLQGLKDTWLLLDDAQNAYSATYATFWQVVVKTISKADIEDNVFVIIAATYDLSTPESPVDFRALEHIKPNVSEDEARELFQMHAKQWVLENWEVFLDHLLRISKFVDGGFYHIGIIMAGVRLLGDMRKVAGQHHFNEGAALSALRSSSFANNLNRCFKLPDKMEQNFEDRLLSVVLQDVPVTEDVLFDPKVAPFTRAGLMTRQGQFSCLAARWYYNRRCFPTRADSAPESLEDLVKLAVSSISAKRLRDTLVNGFPKEAAFQHLFNEAMSLQLPVTHSIIPELSTFATDPGGNPVNGELDFYVNGDKQWCLELLRSGDKIGEHVARFDEHNGKYRKVSMKDYLVVDCRGPKKGAGARIEDPRCTLYFSEDFKKCLCQMRRKEPFEIELQN